MKKKLQIFISSTFTDLIEERQAAVSAILKAGHIPAGMELFTSGDESQMVIIKRWIDESDIFMLILGGRYGSVEPTSSLSYTELEYDYAVNSGKPYFAVVIDDEALERKVKKQGIAVIETDNQKELKLFRQKVLSKISAFFKDSRDIRLAVHETIGDLINRYNFKGWISGAEIPDIQSFTDQINKLREKNEKLTSENETLKRQLSSRLKNSNNEIDYDELIDKLDEIKIEIKVNKLIEGRKGIDLEEIKSLFQLSTEISKTSQIEQSLLEIFKNVKESLITGIYNRTDMSKVDNFLFFNVMPKLQIYELALSESVPNVAYRRFTLTEKGINLAKYINDNYM